MSPLAVVRLELVIRLVKGHGASAELTTFFAGVEFANQGLQAYRHVFVLTCQVQGSQQH